MHDRNISALMRNFPPVLCLYPSSNTPSSIPSHCVNIMAHSARRGGDTCSDRANLHSVRCGHRGHRRRNEGDDQHQGRVRRSAIQQRNRPEDRIQNERHAVDADVQLRRGGNWRRPDYQQNEWYVCARVAQSLYAVLCAHFSSILLCTGSGAFTDKDIEVFGRYLTFCGIGIQNAQLFEMSVQEYRRNQILLYLARSIFEEQNNLECLVTKILLEARTLLKCERCAVYLVDLDCCESVSEFSFMSSCLELPEMLIIC